MLLTNNFPFFVTRGVKSIIWKKMASVHFTTNIRCEPSTANRDLETLFFFFCKFIPVLATWCLLGLKFLEFFLCFYEHF